MKARFLKPGQPVKIDLRVMIFLRRLRHGHEVSGETVNVFQCEDYRGLDDGNASGLATMSDVYFSKHASAPNVRQTREAMARVPALMAEKSRDQRRATVNRQSQTQTTTNL
jgi:hypothetical protein